MLDHFPIDETLPHLIEIFRASRNVVLSAPPGAGKTTRVPIALMSAEWLAGQKLIMLEPRRLAAQRAAQFMASQLGEKIGTTVGYRIRGDSQVSDRTRIEVVTEGILTRRLQHDPELAGVGIVMFDEFHERSVHADLGLALTLDVQAHLREDLRLLIMSATLDGVAVSSLLSDAPIIESPGLSFPVQTHYLSSPDAGPIEARTVKAVTKALHETRGDVLVFLPGVREIRRVEALLLDLPLPNEVRLHMLFGDASPQRQRAALEPAHTGTRKVILSTSIAETSVTIEGVRTVIDAGQSRTASFDPRRGMAGLVTNPVSVATADQRRGRAGREAPGVCYRLWTAEAHERLPRFPTPEILATDLAPLALDLALWGTPEGKGLRFLNEPPPQHLNQARSLLQRLGALDGNGGLTTHGRALAQLPVHPRLAHMILRGKELQLGAMACDIAALLEERDVGGANYDIDLHSRWQALHSAAASGGGLRDRVMAQARRLRQISQIAASHADESKLGLVLSFAYPERLARRRGDEGRRYQMVNGTGAILPDWSLLAREEYIAVADVDAEGTEVRIFLAAPVAKEAIGEAYAAQIRTDEEVFWNPVDESVVARRVRRLGSLVLADQPMKPQGDRVRQAMLDGIRQMGLLSLPWDNSSLSIRNRSEWLRTMGFAGEDWPDLSDDNLLHTLADWLGPFLEGMVRKSHLAQLDLFAILRALFTHRQLESLDRLAPTAIAVPTGSRVRLTYNPDGPAVLAVRLQELFGQTDTPTIAGGKSKVLIHLLSPAGRPLGVTQDLSSFWKNAYPEVRKEMRGRYPKHHWPEDPLAAEPTRRTKSRR